MADLRHSTDGPSPLSDEGYDESLLPDYDREFLASEDLTAFASALSAPDPSPSTDDLVLTSRNSIDQNSKKGPGLLRVGSRSSSIRPEFGSDGASIKSRDSFFITAQNDWAPVAPTRSGNKSKRKGGERTRERKRKQRRSSDETREGYLYTILAWPLLAIVGAWIAGLGASYMLTRLYIWLYEHFVAWRGKRQK